MNIKSYIDQFSEISHLKRDQQFLLLEKASINACAEFKFLNFTIITFLIRAFFLTILSGGSYLLFGYSPTLLIGTVLIGLLLSRVAVTEINTHLMAKSLKNVMLENPIKDS
jgi:hypothetical protein